MQNQSKFFQALATLGGLGAAAWLLVNLAPVLSPFILAAVLAYALAPAVDALAAKRIPRWVGAGLAVCLIMLFMLALLFLVVPVVTKQIPLIREQVPALLTHLNQWIRPLAAHWGLDLAIDVEQVRQSLYALLSSHDQDLLKSLFGTLQSGGSALLTIVGNGVLMPIVAVYLLLDYRRVTEGVFGLVPPRWQS
ncbi:MAG: AI-2E family transporter, partial [Burkholderiaceae bacterium]|nr:AI-2E family transporter [Burkholderiaceae bacterium]